MFANVIGSAVSGLIGGLSSLVISALLAAFALPMPIDKSHHVVGYAIGGFMCGLLSGFMGAFVSMRRMNAAQLESSGTPRARAKA